MGTFNEGGKLAIKGYDPVSYFSNEAKPGDPAITAEHDGHLYYFANPENKAKFEDGPAEYVPAYGGFCATAMSEGKLFDIDPTNFKVDQGRLFLFYNGSGGNTKDQWEVNADERLKNADNHFQAGTYA